MILGLTATVVASQQPLSQCRGSTTDTGFGLLFQTGTPIQLSGDTGTVNASNDPARNGVRLAPGVTLDQIQDMIQRD